MKGRQGPLDEASATDLVRQMAKRIYERALRGELTHQLGYEKHDVAGHRSGNSRNGDFEPQLIAKHQTRLLGFDQKMISM